MPKRRIGSSAGSCKRTQERRAAAAAAAATEEEEVAYDSDLEPPPEDPVTVSSWRLDPDESLSDWTIEIVVNGTSHATYHVHKHVLVVGPRKSGYFVRLFAEGGRFAEAANSKSRIELEPLAAEYFPQLLDYLYFPDRDAEFDTDNTVALYSMANYFEMRRLRFEAKVFWKAGIRSPRTSGTYYEHAYLLNESKLLEAAKAACATNIICIDGKTSRLVHVPDPEFWLHVLNTNKRRITTNRMFSTYFSKHTSTLIAEFALIHRETLDAAMFKKLTNATLLTHIHHEVALLLIDAERQIVASVTNTLSSLQKRCIAALAEKWDCIDFANKETVLKLARKQSPIVLTEILSQTMVAAKTAKSEVIGLLRDEAEEVERKSYKLSRKSSNVRSLTRQLEDKTSQVTSFQSQLQAKTSQVTTLTSQLHAKNSQNTTLSNQLRGKSSELERCKLELSKFHRLQPGPKQVTAVNQSPSSLPSITPAHANDSFGESIQFMTQQPAFPFYNYGPQYPLYYYQNT